MPPTTPPPTSHAPDRPSPRRLLAVAAALATALVVALAVPAPAQEAETDTGTTEGATAAVSSTPVLSARRFPGVVQGTVADPALAAAVDPVLEEGAGTTCVRVVDDGRPALVREAGATLVPASLEKLLTATAALEVLGTDRTLRTTASAAAPPAGGVVDGDLYLVGGGDPLLTTEGYRASFEDPDQSINPFEALADAIAAAGVTQIRGDVVGDDSRYSQERWIPSWPERYQREGFVGPLGALMVNDGFTGYVDTPGEPTEDRRAGDPAALAAETLVTLLEERGVTVTGSGTSGTAPDGATEVAHLDSLPMGDIVAEMLSDSDNTTAELLTREMGLVASGDPSTPAGLAALGDALTSLGFDTTGLALLDGSGLDPANQVPCDLVLAALERAGTDSLIGRSLAVAGESGTLRERLGESGTSGQIQAKTGTLNEVNALAGFAVTQAGDDITFVLLQNGSMARGPEYIDDLVQSLLAYPQAPPLEQLGPNPPTP